MKYLRQTVVDCFVSCIPATTTKQQLRVVSLPKGMHMSYQPAKVKQAEATYLSLFMEHAPAQPLDGPLSIMLEFHFPLKKTERKVDKDRGWVFRDTRPDIENLTKLFIDAIAPRYFVDDARICEMTIRKYRAQQTGVRLQISRLLYVE